MLNPGPKAEAVGRGKIKKLNKKRLMDSEKKMVSMSDTNMAKTEFQMDCRPIQNVKEEVSKRQYLGEDLHDFRIGRYFSNRTSV